jgi:hypothetical protein
LSAPAWTAASHAPVGIPVAVSVNGLVAAFFFAHQLRAPAASDASNKILWVVRLPRQGQDLRITARPLGRTEPVVVLTESASASPGEIYPSIVDMPTAGCWQFMLTWAGHEDSMDVQYHR